MVSQNLFLCLLLSALAGITTIAGKAVVVSMARRRKNQLQTTRIQKGIMIFQFILFMALANTFTFLAPWFGPISIYWPATIASQLISNMIIIGLIMGHEKIDKNIQVATLVVVTAVLYITINGPEPQDGQDILELVLGNLLAIVWLGLLIVLYLGCFLLLCFGQLNKRPPVIAEGVFLMIATCSSTLSGTTSKAASTLDGSEGPYRTILIASTWLSLGLWTACSFKEAAYVRSMAQYIPQVTFGSILMNAVTGLIVWEDYRVVLSWAGYLTSVLLLGMGVYLISDLDFFKAQAQDQQDFHRQLNNIQDFFSNIEEDLAKARLEKTLGRHQITIIEASARQGLTRGASDPEVGAKSSRAIDDSDQFEESDQFTVTVPSTLPSTRSCGTSGGPHRRGLTRSTSQRSLHSIDALSQNFRSLREMVGEISLDDDNASDVSGLRNGGDAESCRNALDASTKSGSSYADSDMDSVSTLGTSKSLGGSVGLRGVPSTLNLRQQFLRQSSGLLELSRSTHSSRRLHRQKSVVFDLKKDQGEEDNILDADAGSCIRRPFDVVRAPNRATSNASSAITFDDETEDDDSLSGDKIDSHAGDIENQLDEILDEIQTLPAEHHDNDREDCGVDTMAVSEEISCIDASEVTCQRDLKPRPLPEDLDITCNQRATDDMVSSACTESTLSSAPTRGETSVAMLEQDEHTMETEMDELMDTIRNI